MSILSVKSSGLLSVDASIERRKESWYTYDPESPTRDDKVPELFVALGQAQRGKPERAMVKFQFANVGGALSPILEHVGDLTHRITHHAGLGRKRRDLIDTDTVKDKVDKTLRWITHPYGVDREHGENLRSNAREKGRTLEEHTRIVDAAMEVYTEAHRNLVVYNRPQHLCQMAAIYVGEKNFRMAELVLENLQTMIARPDWLDQALSYGKDSFGKVRGIKWMYSYRTKWPKGRIQVE